MSSDFDAPSGSTANFAPPPPPSADRSAAPPPPPAPATAPVPPPPGAPLSSVAPAAPLASAVVPPPPPVAPAPPAPLPAFAPTTPAPPVPAPPGAADPGSTPATDRLPLLDMTSPAHVAPTTPPPPAPPAATTAPIAPPPAPPAPMPLADIAPPPGPAPIADEPQSAPAPAPAPAPMSEAPTAAKHDLDDILSQMSNISDDELLDDPTLTAPAVGTKLTDARDLERPKSASDVVIVPDGGLDFDPTFASFLHRALGLVIDSVIVHLAMLPGFALILGTSSTVLSVVGVALMIAGFLAVAALSAKAISARKQWIGNRVTKTSVVNGITGANLTFTYALFRNIVRHAISPVLLIGFLAAFADGQRRTFHDRLAGSVVIGREREVWTPDQGEPAS